VARLNTPIEAARAGLAVVELLWLARRAAARHGVRVDPGEAARLRRVGRELAEAVEAAERGEAGALERVDVALVAAATEARPVDSVARLLSEASKELSSFLDLEGAFAAVARLMVPALAEVCSFHLREENGLRRLASAQAEGMADGPACDSLGCCRNLTAARTVIR